MKRKMLSLIAATALSASLIACGSEAPKETATGSNQTQVENKEESTTSNKKGTSYTVEGAIVEDAGITQTVKEVSIFDNMTDAVKSFGQSDLVVDEENKDKVTVVVNFEIKNSNDFMISTYPTQATFVTNTGEQVEADMWASESFDGDIYEGVTKEGHVLFNLSKTAIADLTSFKMMWNTNHENGTDSNYDDDYYKENKLEITLK